MTKYSLKFMVLVVSIFFFTACSSQKSTTDDSTADKTERRGERGQRQQGKRERPNFTKLLADMDANKDGKISKDEAKGPLQRDFGKMDANEDGFVTKEEFQSYKPARRPRQ